MARGKFNKRGGGPRLDAVNEEEIAQRNARLAELEEERNRRRADEDEEGEEEGAEQPETEKKSEEPASNQPGDKKKDGDAPTGPVTTEADHRRNLAKLAEVRRRREEAEARRKLEEATMEQQEEERKKLAEMTLKDDEDDEDDGKKKKKSSKPEIPKLDKITIKKMKPTQLKDALKERDLDIQGNAKTLLDRLLAYEAAR